MLTDGNMQHLPVFFDGGVSGGEVRCERERERERERGREIGRRQGEKGCVRGEDPG